MKKSSIFNLVLSGFFIAMGVILPMLFHSFGLLGGVFLPMHIPVLLCGFICGWKYGLPVGIIIPFLSSFVTGMPPLFPVAIAMSLELGAYGLVSGLLKKRFNSIITLIIAMLVGRVVMGVSFVLLLGFVQKAYSINAFIEGAFVIALPGIILQLILIPLIFEVLKKSKILNNFA
jgi:hypothetical protein